MKIPIRCKGNRYLPWNELQEFQGNLKKISKENLLKLRALILKHGWIAPVFVWNDTEILDGHGRLLALKGLLSDGYEIEDIPIVDIEAKSRTEAAEILLSINSHFQSITEAGLKEYMDGFEIKLEELKDYVLPDIDVAKFAASYFQKEDSKSDEVSDNKENRILHTKYLIFMLVERLSATNIYSVVSKTQDMVLGQIKWFGRWRQYTFFPESNTVWNKDCLNDVEKFLNDVNEQHKQKKKESTN